MAKEPIPRQTSPPIGRIDGSPRPIGGVTRHAVTGPAALVLLGQQAIGVADGDEDAKGEAGHQRRT